MQYWSTQNNYSPPQAQSNLGRGLADLQREINAPAAPNPPRHHWHEERLAAAPVQLAAPDALAQIVGEERAAALRLRFPDLGETCLLVLGILLADGGGYSGSISKRLLEVGVSIKLATAHWHFVKLTQAGLASIETLWRTETGQPVKWVTPSPDLQ